MPLCAFFGAFLLCLLSSLAFGPAAAQNTAAPPPADSLAWKSRWGLGTDLFKTYTLTFGSSFTRLEFPIRYWHKRHWVLGLQAGYTSEKTGEFINQPLVFDQENRTRGTFLKLMPAYVFVGDQPFNSKVFPIVAGNYYWEQISFQAEPSNVGIPEQSRRSGMAFWLGAGVESEAKITHWMSFSAMISIERMVAYSSSSKAEVAPVAGNPPVLETHTLPGYGAADPFNGGFSTLGFFREDKQAMTFQNWKVSLQLSAVFYPFRSEDFRPKQLGALHCDKK